VKPTVKQHLAAIRQLFDYLITIGILEVNPGASVRGPRYVVKRGKIPVLSAVRWTPKFRQLAKVNPAL
jgi:site-specific recombinase XerC